MVRLLGDRWHNGNTKLEHYKSPRGDKVGLPFFFFFNDGLISEARSLLSSSILLRRREVYMQAGPKNKFPESPFKRMSLAPGYRLSIENSMRQWLNNLS